MILRSLILLIGTAALCYAPTALAIPYTVGPGITFGGSGGAWGTINPVNDLTGIPVTIDGTVTNGTGGALDTVGQDVFIFSITLNGGSEPVDEVGAASVFNSLIEGAGYFGGPGNSPTGPNSVNGLSVYADIGGALGRFGYDHGTINPLTNLNAGDTSVRLFVTYQAGSMPGLANLVSFMISEAAGPQVSFQTPPVVVVPIPEPGTVGLLGLGLVALAVTSRRRGASAA